MIGGNPDVAMGVVGCLVVLISISLLRFRGQSSAAVRLALSDPRPATRRAAVLVAARHGLTHHARLLVAHARQETAGEVLLTLAEAVREYGCAGRGSPARLRRWSEGFLRVREPSGSADHEETSPHRSSGQDLVHAPAAIDALQMFDAVEPPASGPGRAEGALLPASPWTAALGELDPLAVLASLEGRSGTMSMTRTPSPRQSAEVEPGHHRDHEALVDRLAGLERKPPPLARLRTGDARIVERRQAATRSPRRSVGPLDRTGRRGLFEGAVQEAAGA